MTTLYRYTFGISPASDFGPFTYEVQEDCDIAAWNKACKMVREMFPPNDGTTICQLGKEIET